jgi:hypothetical protein
MGADAAKPRGAPQAQDDDAAPTRLGVAGVSVKP